jgi:hypothetical protein
MPLSCLHANYHKQAVTHIRESLQRKPDQHTTHIPRSVRVCSQTIRISRGQHRATFRIVVNKFEQIHCSRSNPQHTGWLVCGSVPSFSPITDNKAVRKKQASVDNQLVGLPDTYLRHAIDTFNTCSRGPTHRSLTDIGGGYNLGVASFLHHTPRPS